MLHVSRVLNNEKRNSIYPFKNNDQHYRRSQTEEYFYTGTYSQYLSCGYCWSYDGNFHTGSKEEFEMTQDEERILWLYKFGMHESLRIEGVTEAILRHLCCIVYGRPVDVDAAFYYAPYIPVLREK